jgi:hypothetical protein
MLSIDISQSSLKIRHFQQNLLSIRSVSCEVLWNMGLVRKEIVKKVVDEIIMMSALYYTLCDHFESLLKRFGNEND